VLVGSDPLGFDYILLDYICYIGLLCISEKSSKKRNNKKKYRENIFPLEYIKLRIREEHDHKNLNKFIPLEIFSQSLHELRGLNSKISGHVEKMIELTSEDNWIDQFNDADEDLKKLYVGTRLTKFILDNTKFYNPNFLNTLSLDKSFSFYIHKSIFKIVKIYENDFTADKSEITFTGSTYRRLLGEKEYFEIIIKILIENALKYSTDKRIGPKIEISNFGNSKVKMTIKSFGKIIPFEEREDIFSRGYRSSVHRNSRGTGMGLYIAKSLANLYGASLKYYISESNLKGDANIGWNTFELVLKNALEKE